MSRILDKSFKYVPAAKTNIAKTFARVRRELEAKAIREARNAEEAAFKVKPMKAAHG